MTDSHLQRLRREQLVNPSKDGQTELLAVLKRSGALQLSKQNINLLASLGIEPVVRAFLNGPPTPRWMSNYPGYLMPTYKCLHGLRGCWSCFPHKHPVDGGERTLKKQAPPYIKNSSRGYALAEVGWAHLHCEDLAWVGSRIFKAGWKPSIIALSSLHNMLRRHTGFVSQEVTPFIRDVEECVYAAAAVARSNVPDAIASIKVRASEIRNAVGVLEPLAHRWTTRYRIASLSLLILEKNHCVPQIIWDAIHQNILDGRTNPRTWERALSRPDRHGNRNKTFGPKPMFALLETLVRACTEHPPDKISQIIHQSLQNSLFEFYTGQQLIRG